MIDGKTFETLKELAPALQSCGVGSLYVFGSVAKGTETAESDLDVFVDPFDKNFFKFRNFMAAYALLEDAFPQREIGYGTREGLSPFIRETIEREAIKIF